MEGVKKVYKYLDTTHQEMYRILVFTDTSGTRPVYNSGNNARHSICLYYRDGYFDLIKTPQKLFLKKHYCVDREKTYEDLKDHSNCKNRCPQCFRNGYGYPCVGDMALECPDCHKLFPNHDCMAAHKPYSCNAYHRCIYCCVQYRRSLVADDSALDEELNEGNQVRLEEDLNPFGVEQYGDVPETPERRREAEVDIRPPPARLASVVVLPPVQPSAPLKVHSVVVTNKYKQVSDDTREGFGVNTRCDREMPGHENCRHLLLKEVDQMAPSELRNLPIRTPLQHALVLLATRGAYGEQTNMFLRRLLKREVAAKAITVFSRFRNQRQDPTAMIKRTDLVEAMTTRYKRCCPAKEFLDKDPYLAIWYRTRCHEMAPDDIEQFRSLFGDLADALESVRTRELFPGRARVKISAAIIGDHLADELKKSQQEGGLAITATATAKVLEALHTYVFGASCKYLVMLTGHSDLREGRKPKEIFDDCRRIVRHLERYPHLKVYWVPLPFIYDQRHSWTMFIEKMRGIGEGAPNHIFLDSFNGRDTLEMFREGNAFAMDRIDNAGRPTVAGWRVLTSFLREAVRIPITGTIASPKRAKKRARREMNAAVRALDDVHLEAGPSRAESPTGSVVFVEPTAKHDRHFHDSPY